jgi:hypothetical protein
MRRERSEKLKPVSDSDAIRSEGVPIVNGNPKIRFNL